MGTSLIAMTAFLNSSKNSALSKLDDDKNNELGNPWEYSIIDFFTVKKEMIVHGTSNEDSLNSILTKGLLSRRKLAEFRLGRYYQEAAAKEAIEKGDHFKKKFGALDSQQIFFAPKESQVVEDGNVGILVNPNKTYVFNMSYKAKADPADIDLDQYKKSKILLSTYLQQVKEAKKMQEAQPDKEVVLDPQTAKPFYIDRSDSIPVSYHAEIPFNTDRISPFFLHFIQKDIFEVNFEVVAEIH